MYGILGLRLGFDSIAGATKKSRAEIEACHRIQVPTRSTAGHAHEDRYQGTTACPFKPQGTHELIDSPNPL